ncbi:hypothetical protein JAAARDRAFT_27593 [Jaapia argillacea MUCL 33604]|uniref:Uncharacterized protein n=1 Tax=Jaapia argillacea MUCL 33604 TaxID=933084 RepID=A0A067QKB1_9AGAM|nr:hypothetical protein JAAARDRAFT_27593 [Jaapia argillacea MUCL 33604]
MLSTRTTILRTSLSRARLLHTSPTLFASNTSGGQDASISQGHTTSPSNKSPRDPQSQSASSGINQRASSSDSYSLDASSSEPSQHQKHTPKGGNPEGVGFTDQVGSQSASSPGSGTVGEHGKKGEEEASAPGFVASVKQALGVGTSAGEVKQNRCGGEGVTGTGTGPRQAGNRKFHTSAFVSEAGNGAGAGGVPDAARQPKEPTYGEQNEHLRHKKNAGEEPELPSRRSKSGGEEVDRITNPAGGKTQRRSFSTTSSSNSKTTKHTTDSYMKDADTTPPPDKTTHTVADLHGEGSQVQKASEPEPATGGWTPLANSILPDTNSTQGSIPEKSQQKRGFVTSAISSSRRGFFTSAAPFQAKHSAESYFKDVDSSPPPDQKTHTVADADTEGGAQVQRASEAASGEWSRAGVGEGEDGKDVGGYESVSKTEPYSASTPSSQEGQSDLRYGGKEKWNEDEGKGKGGVSGRGEGPHGGSRGGRGPEGKRNREGM